MAYARILAGRWTELTGPFVIGDLQYPANWPDLATAGERIALGVLEIAEPGPQPTDVDVIGTNVIGIDSPRRIWVTKPRPIEQVRQERWTAAKDVREARMGGGCMTPLGRVDTDPDSQRKIVGAVTGALIAQAAGAPYSIDWTMSDNSVVTHDGPAAITMGVAVLGHITACQDAGTQIRLAIEAAETARAVSQVDIDAGYPA